MKASDVTLLQLRDAMLCIECELISYNNTTTCLACGSSAVLSLSRVLGGSLRGKQTANLVGDDVLGKIVYDNLEPFAYSQEKMPELSVACSDSTELTPASAMQFVVERAFTLTRADGAALAMWQGNRMVCQAHAGGIVPDVGSEVQTSGGLSGLTVRTGRAWRCNDAETDHRVNAEACRDLGIRSVIAAPLNHLNRVLGILQVLSSQPFAFDDRDVASVQILSQLMVMAFARRSENGTGSVDSRMRLAFAGGALL
jgi:GAF domain-containing protein